MGTAYNAFSCCFWMITKSSWALRHYNHRQCEKKWTERVAGINVIYGLLQFSVENEGLLKNKHILMHLCH